MDNPLEKIDNLQEFCLGTIVWLPSLDLPIVSLPSVQLCTIATSLTKSMRHGTLLRCQTDNYDNSWWTWRAAYKWPL